MPGLSSPYRSTGPLGRQRSTSPLPPPPPAKAIDLNSSTRTTDRETGTKITRRAFLCDVVLEREGEETANLLQHLGRPLAPLSTLPAPAPPTLIRPVTPSRRSGSGNDEDGEVNTLWTREKHAEMALRLGNLIEELVKTERSYLMRVQALKKSYADPLRKFAKEEMSKIIPLYEAKTLFTNIDAIVPAAAVFLADLEAMYTSGHGAATVGDVCLRHLRDMRTLDPYRTYLSKQDESQKTFQEVFRKYSSFGAYIERTKYSTLGIGNIGLRELLMEPVQRIPRYTLLWQTMIKCLPPLSPQRTKLQECIGIASRIAKCEPDPQTVRATVMYCLERNVDGFPANLFSNNRDYIDSIDVDDMPVEAPANASPGSRFSSRPMSVISASTSASTPSLASYGSSASSAQLPNSPHSAAGAPGAALTPLHCTLFLFDDKLMIVKRQASNVSGRKVTGLDDVARLVKTGGGVAVIDKNGSRKDKLSCRGVVNVSDIIATDVGNGDFHLFFEQEPANQGDRWSSRPFRSYTTVSPPFGSGIDPVTIRRDKLRFLQNLWAAQAQVRAKISPKEVDARAVPRVLMADDEVALDGAGDAFERAKCFWNVWDRQGWTNQARKAKVAVHIDEDDLASELSLHEGDPCMVIRLQPMAGGLCRFSYATATNDGEGRLLIDMSEVEERIVTTIHRYGVFKFRTSANSCPTTPSSTSHRLRPSMLNLDMISRNLFGQASLSGKSNASSDMFGSSSTRRKAMSRTSTIDTSRFSASSGHSDEQRPARASSMSPGRTLDEGLPSRAYAVPGMGQSEVDLNERLNLARRNSKSMAALSPAKARLGAKSVAELRSQVENREVDDVRRERLGAKSTGDLRREQEDLDEAVREAGSPTPMSPTAPLMIRNKTPSPTKAMSGPRAVPASLTPGSPMQARAKLDSVWNPQHSSVDQVLSSTLPALPSFGSPFGPLSTEPAARNLSPVQQVISSVGAVLASAATTSSTGIVTSPQSVTSPTMKAASTTVSLVGATAPLSPRPQGPRSPAARVPVPSLASGLGSAHTKLRIVSGNGRRVSVGRETVPLKGTADENESPDANSDHSTPTFLLSKRQHSEDQITPRKRSPVRSPLNPLVSREDDGQLAEPLRVPSASGGVKRVQPRRVSGHNTPKERSSHRRASGANSVASQGSVTPSMTGSLRDSTFSAVNNSGAGNAKVHVEHETVADAVDATKRKIVDSRAGVKRLKVEVNSLRKQLSSGTEGLSRRYSQSSLPRSPHRRNINRLVDYDDQPPASRVLGGAGKLELDTMLIDETARGVAALVEKVDGVLKSALGDGEQASGLALRFATQLAEREMEVKSLQAQVLRGKENQELLRGQLAEVQVEVDVIYEAFNTELDGMYNDTQLPPTPALEAMRRDLQETKASRNDIALENMRLKRELEEANLKREQWAKILRERGVL